MVVDGQTLRTLDSLANCSFEVHQDGPRGDVGDLVQLLEEVGIQDSSLPR